MNKLTFFPVVFCAITAVYAQGQQPVEYFGAVAQFPESQNYYLTKDSYDEVKAFYVNKYGSPDHESKKEETKRAATFFYEETIFEPRGIHLSEILGNSRAVVHVFSELKGLIVREILTQAGYDKIEEKYKHLKDYYYVDGEDEAIYDKYHKMLGAGGTEALDTEEIMTKAQELIMAGKTEEGKALLESMRDGMISNMEYAGSEKAIDSWMDCLEELDAVKYP
ncbi:MAG: hypothetical protein R6V32_09285, partial [Bacteroidales bacterium]